MAAVFQPQQNNPKSRARSLAACRTKTWRKMGNWCCFDTLPRASPEADGSMARAAAQTGGGSPCSLGPHWRHWISISVHNLKVEVLVDPTGPLRSGLVRLPGREPFIWFLQGECRRLSKQQWDHLAGVVVEQYTFFGSIKERSRYLKEHCRKKTINKLQWCADLDRSSSFAQKMG